MKGFDWFKDKGLQSWEHLFKKPLKKVGYLFHFDCFSAKWWYITNSNVRELSWKYLPNVQVHVYFLFNQRMMKNSFTLEIWKQKLSKYFPQDSIWGEHTTRSVMFPFFKTALKEKRASRQRWFWKHRVIVLLREHGRGCSSFAVR